MGLHHDHSHGHHHHHGHGGHRHGDLKRLQIAIAINVVVVIVEATSGYLTGSLALLSDAGHNLTDVGALAVAYFATRFATLPPTSRQSYGYYRLEMLSALANALALGIVSVLILIEAYERFQAPPEVPGGAVLIVSALALAGNLLSAGVLMARRESVNMRAAFLHLVADAVSSVGVLIAGAIILFTGQVLADPVASVLIAGIIIVSSTRLLWEVVGVLLQGVPRHVEPAEVRAALQRCSPDILAVHDLHVWSLTSQTHVATLHVVVPPEALVRSPEIIHAVTDVLHDQFGVSHVTVQVEPEGFEEPGDVHE